MSKDLRKREEMRKVLTTSSLLMLALLTTGCMKNENLNVGSYSQKIKEKAIIPAVCKTQYESVMPTVAVVDFTNNSTFGKASINTIKRKKNSAAVVGVGIGANGLIAGGASASKSNMTNTKRKIDAKISESVVSLVENQIVSNGGAKIFTRKDMDKIDAELKFQDSGLLDPNTVVEFGKTSGVRYIITGSIDNISQEYRGNADAANTAKDATKSSDNKTAKMLTSMLSIAADLTDGMIVKTALTVRVLDVQSGKVVLSKTLEGDKNIGKIKEPTYDQIIGGVKLAISESLVDINKEFANYFSVQGYVTQVRKNADDVIVQVNIGEQYKVKENQLFDVYVFEENEDPMTGKITCDRIKTSTRLKASNQITSTHTWTTVDSDVKDIKLLQLVRKSHEVDSGFNFPKF